VIDVQLMFDLWELEIIQELKNLLADALFHEIEL